LVCFFSVVFWQYCISLPRAQVQNAIIILIPSVCPSYSCPNG